MNMILTCFRATHAGILASVRSTKPHDSNFSPYGTLPTYQDLPISIRSFGCKLSPHIFGAATLRPVSYYALFSRVAASKPTSWLSGRHHILVTLSLPFGGLSCRSGLFPSRLRTFSPAVSLPWIRSTVLRVQLDLVGPATPAPSGALPRDLLPMRLHLNAFRENQYHPTRLAFHSYPQLIRDFFNRAPGSVLQSV